VDFAWHAGNWRYKKIIECPGDIKVKNIEGDIELIRRIETDEAEETLGIFIAPDGNRRRQVEKMIKLGKDWVENMKAGRLSRSEIWTAWQSTIGRTLVYPLPALNLTQQECLAIMAPIIQFLLPALGICRSFPRDIVFAPKTFFGLGIQHLYTLQETIQLCNIVKHTHQSSITGLLYLGSLELLHTELGTTAPLHSIDYDKWAVLTTDSLIKSSWQFLWTNQL
jgi:hypothetical protein